MATVAPPHLESQYRLLRERAGLVERGERRHVDLRGPDAVDYLQGQVSNDIASLVPGRGCYALLLNPKGRILADLRVLMVSEHELWLDTEPVALERLFLELEKYSIGRQVEIARSAERVFLSLIGPQARAIIEVAVPQEEHAFVAAEIGGAQAVLAATDLGVDVLVEPVHAERVRTALRERDVVEVSEEVADIRRIERGRPRYGQDMTADNLPAELGLEERAVSFDKGCYVGQEPVARMHYRGHPNRYLRGLKLAEPASVGHEVRSGERAVGKVSSACISPALGPIALAVLRREVEPGQTVLVGADGAPATVANLPFEES